MTAAAVEVRGLRIRHHGNLDWAPDGASFALAPGTVTLLLGPSGSGKSTLALALNGLVPQAIPAEVEGEVRIGDAAITGLPVARVSEQVAMVFQDPDAQLVTGSLIDEVCFGPENLRLPAEEVLLRAERALRQVGLWQRRAENPDRLSGGGKQRLAIAAALAMDTPVLVLDEPTANLDPVGVEEVYAVLAELVREGGRTVLLIEHNLDAAVELVDRVLVLDRSGRVAVDGSPREVFGEQHQTLLELGVWLPVAALAALRLQGAGLRLQPLPLSHGELSAALDAEPTLPERPAVTAAERPARSPLTAARAPLLSVRGLRVARQRKELLHGIDLDLATGGFLGVIGTNGAGKTTLIQALAGVVRPPRGQVRIAGRDVAAMDVRELSSRIGFVFQNPEHQFVTGSVAEELAHGLRRRRRPAAEIAERVDAMLERFGLSAERDRHPYLLSGGQKRRLSVGTALIGGAPLLVLDEPTFGQDRSRAGELLELLRELNEQGTTVIVVSHDLQLVADYADRVAVLHRGGLLAEGPTGRILGDEALLAEAGLLAPPLARAMAGVQHHPEWRGIARLDDLPGAPAATAAGADATGAGAGAVLR